MSGISQPGKSQNKWGIKPAIISFKIS
jgi:hypothetical protein